ncbi:MAG: putative toxin-antitoxin system toxin component, PIN family [Opitutales bacterium]
MIIVLDTSVLVAAQITTTGTCADVVKLTLREHRLVLSDHILEEFERTMVRKLRYPAEAARSFVTDYRAVSALVTPVQADPNLCRDPADAAILGTALAAKADMLVTVDKDLLDITAKVGVDIVNPREFFRRTHS